MTTYLPMLLRYTLGNMQRYISHYRYDDIDLNDINNSLVSIYREKYQDALCKDVKLYIFKNTIQDEHIIIDDTDDLNAITDIITNFVQNGYDNTMRHKTLICRIYINNTINVYNFRINELLLHIYNILLPMKNGRYELYIDNITGLIINISDGKLSLDIDQTENNDITYIKNKIIEYINITYTKKFEEYGWELIAPNTKKSVIDKKPGFIHRYKSKIILITFIIIIIAILITLRAIKII